MSSSSNPHSSNATDGSFRDSDPTTAHYQLAKSFILLGALIKKIENVESRVEDTDERIDVSDFYGPNPPSDDDEGQYDLESLDRLKTELEKQLGKLKPERVERMLDVVRWAAKAETGKFLPAEILAMIRVYVSLENDEDGFGDYDTDSNVYYAGRGSFTDDVDDIYGSY